MWASEKLGIQFPDDTKIGSVVDSAESCPRLRQDIDQVENQVGGWQMEYCPDKCEVLHFWEIKQMLGHQGMSNMETKEPQNLRP